MFPPILEKDTNFVFFSVELNNIKMKKKIKKERGQEGWGVCGNFRQGSQGRPPGGGDTLAEN